MGNLVIENTEPLMGDPVTETVVLDGLLEPDSLEPLVGKFEFDPDIIIEPTAGVPLPEDFVTDDAPDGAENGQS